MRQSCSLTEVVHKLFGSQFHRVPNPKVFEYQFRPFRHQESGLTYYFKIVEVPAYFQISSELMEMKIKKYKKYLNPVTFIMFERTFQSCFYLIKSETNILPLSQLLDIKKGCNQLLEEDKLLALIEFELQLSRQGLRTDWKPHSIGINLENQFKICDHMIYFTESDKKEPKITSHFKQNLCDIILPILNPSKADDECSFELKEGECEDKKWSDCEHEYETDDNNGTHASSYGSLKNNFQCSFLENKYDSRFLAFVEEIIQFLGDEQTANAEKRQAKSALEQLQRFRQNRRSELNTTMTQSFNEEFIVAEIVEVDKAQSNATYSQVLVAKPKKKMGVLAKIVLVAILLGILIGAALLVFKLIDRQIQCESGQFLAQKRCLSCTEGCLRCEGGNQQQCTSCVTQMFLVLDSQESRMGSCKKNCTGIPVIHTHHCINKNTTEPSNGTKVSTDQIQQLRSM